MSVAGWIGLSLLILLVLCIEAWLHERSRPLSQRSLRGRIGIVTEPIHGNSPGRVSLAAVAPNHLQEWTAFSDGHILRNRLVIIEEVEGGSLRVRPLMI